MSKLLYVCEATNGGIAEYAIAQSKALTDLDISVTFVCPDSFPIHRLAPGIHLKLLDLQRFTPVVKKSHKSKLLNAFRFASRLRFVASQVDHIATDMKFKKVLFACYKEYFAPFWVGPLKRLRDHRTHIGIVAHDPVRDFVVGPMWWHRWSIRCAYSFVTSVFVHDNTPVDFGGRKPNFLSVYEIPHGPYEMHKPVLGRSCIRGRYGFSEDSTDLVFLAFGNLRDGKNLHLFLQAMPQTSSKIKLLVAGNHGSSSSRPARFYQQMANDLGIAHRCVWDIRHVPDEELGDIFDACDAVLITYNASFRSASGVLNSAVFARKPVLASSGESPLKKAVERYELGRWIRPDSVDAIIEGLRNWSDIRWPAWEIYLRENSWEENARRIKDAMDL